MENNAPVKTDLTKEEAERMASVFARLQELRSAPADIELVSRTPDAPTLTREAEIAALVDYLAPALLEHAAEFLGCWFAVQREYSPLVRALGPVLMRLQAMQPKSPNTQ